jgi:hypothetical protein
VKNTTYVGFVGKKAINHTNVKTASTFVRDAKVKITVQHYATKLNTLVHPHSNR